MSLQSHKAQKEALVSRQEPRGFRGLTDSVIVIIQQVAWKFEERLLVPGGDHKH